jgi:hypothetical protein
MNSIHRSRNDPLLPAYSDRPEQVASETKQKWRRCIAGGLQRVILYRQ